jgi:hypothetical protein
MTRLLMKPGASSLDQRVVPEQVELAMMMDVLMRLNQSA